MNEMSFYHIGRYFATRQVFHVFMFGVDYFCQLSSIHYFLIDIHIHCFSKGRLALDIEPNNFGYDRSPEQKRHQLTIVNSWTWWLSGKLGALRPEGHKLESHSRHQVGTIGKSFTRGCL